MSEEATTAKNWNILYPIYIDQDYSQGKGRRLPKESCVSNPTAVEMCKIIEKLGIPCAVEGDKRHCATPRNFGRVRFLLQKDDESFYNDDVKSKQQLLTAIAADLSEQRQAQHLQKLIDLEKKAQQQPQQQAATANAGGKGKKRR